MRLLRKIFNFGVPFIAVYAMMLIVLPMVLGARAAANPAADRGF